MAGKRRRAAGSSDWAMTKKLTKLAQFEEFEDEILPALRGAIKEGKSAEDIYKLVQAAAAARIATIAVKEADSTKALAAAKDILDRTQGKAKERTEVEHKYGKLKEEELDSLLISQLGEVDDEEETETH